MRTVEVKLFQYDELSEEAKEKARNWWRSIDSYGWHSENRETLEAFCNAFPVDAKDWEYSPYHARISPRFTGEDELGELSGLRLRTYLVNGSGWSRLLWQAKTYSKHPDYWPGVKKRKSRIIVEPTSCPLTGFYLDEVLLDVLRAFIAKPDGRTCAELLGDCLHAWANACRDDMAANETDEAAEDAIRANEYEFTEDGERY